MADPSTQQLLPDETDLLIRSISTLLYSLWPYTPQTTPTDSTYPRLNNLALLFVSSARGDSAAIATFVSKDNIHVEVIREHPNEPDQSQLRNFQISRECEVANGRSSYALQDARAPHERDQSQLRVCQDVKTSVLQQVHDGVGLVALQEELLRNPVRFCFTKGLDAITPELHGNVLQDLLTRMYGVEADRRQEAEDTLIRYIFCFGIRKIRHRLNTKIDKSALSYIDLLTSSNISKEEFIAKRTNVKVKLPQKLENADEKWLREALEENYPDTRVDSVQKGNSVQVRLTTDQEWNLWALFKQYLQSLKTLTLGLESFTKGSPQLKPDLEDRLPLDLEDTLPLGLGGVLRMLHLLTNNSPTFWTIMEQRKELLSGISRQLGEDFRMEQGLPNSPPTPAPPQGGGGALQKPTEADADAEPSDAETDYSAWQYTQSDDAEVRSGAQPPRTRGPSDSTPSRHMRHDEPERGLSASIREIRRWLVLLTEWYQAVRQLCNRSITARFLANKSLTIHVELAPQPFTPNRQASLRSTLDSLSLEADSDTRLDLVIAKARAKFPNRNGNAQDAISVLLNASPKDEDTLQAWETKFNGTSVHCEALLACYLKAQNAANKPIGTSKWCCFCCALVLQHLGFKDKHIGRHGKVYPWSPPPGADVGTKEAVLRGLKDRLATCLRLQYERHRTGDSGPISSSGSPLDGTEVLPLSSYTPLSEEDLSYLEAIIRGEGEVVGV